MPAWYRGLICWFRMFDDVMEELGECAIKHSNELKEKRDD